jgi:dihydroflavonol-4-reductase
VDFLNRRMPAYLDTGLNWVHVRDVAIGHILAAEKGRLGERYILGNVAGNWTLQETFTAMEELWGCRLIMSFRRLRATQRAATD